MSKSESFSTTQVYTPFDFMAWLLDGLNCAAVLYGALPPMFAIIGVAIGTMLVFLLVQRCYQFYRDPYSDVVRREPWRAPVPFWRCLIVHHVYASVLFPCGPRCCIVHAAECTVHVGVLMACTAFGYWKMAPVTEFMSASEERSLQGGIVLLALLLRLVYVRPGWLFRWVPVAPEHLYPDEPMPSEWAPTEPPSIQSPNNSFASVAPTKECGTPEEKEVSFSSDIELDDGLMLAVQNGPDFADPPPQDNKLPTAPSTSSGARSQVLDFDLVIDDDLIFRPREEPDIELLDPSFSGTFDQNGHRARSDQDDPLALHRFGVVDTAAQRDQLVRTKTTNELRFGANLDDIEEVGTQHKRASVWALPSAFTPPEDDLYGSPIKRLSTFSAMVATPPSEEAAARTTISTTPTFDVTPLPKNQDKKGSVRAGAPPAEFRSTNASQLTLSNIDLQSTRSSSVVRLPPAAAPDVRGQRSATLGDTLTSALATKSGDSSTKTVVLHVEDIPTWTNDLAFDDEDLAFDTSTGVATIVAGVGGGGGARLKPRGRHTPPAASLDRRHTNLAPSDVATRRATLPETLRESPPPAAQRRVRIAESHADSIAIRDSTDRSARRATLPDNKALRRKSTGAKLSPGSASLSPSEAAGGGTRCLDVNRDNSRVIELSGFTEDIAFGDDVFEDDDEDADLDGNERGCDADGLPRLRSKSVFLGKPPPLFGVDATVHPNQLVADDSPTKASKQRDDRHQELFARVLANGEANPLLEPQDPTLLHNAQVLVTSRFTEEMRFDEDALDDGAEGAPDGSGGLPVETRDPARLQRERAYSTAARVKLWDTAVYATEGGPDDSRVDGGEHEEDPQDDGGGVRNAMEHTNSHRRASVFHNATFRSIASVRADAPFHLDIDVDDVLRTNTKREAWLDAIEVHSEEISDGEQQTTRKQQQTTQQQRRKSSLWTTDMAFADLDGGEQDVCSNQDVSIVVDASAVDPHNHRRADLYTHDAAMLYDDLFENDDMAGIAFPLGATAASMYGAERRHQDAKVKMDQVFADAPFTDQMAFDDLDIDDDLVVVDMEEPHPSDKIDALVPGTSAAKYRMTRGASLKVLHDDGATVVSRRATFGHHPAAMDALDEAVALEGSTIMDTSQHAARNRRATFGHHPAAAFAASEDKMGGGDAAWAWGDAISDNGSYRLDLDGLDAYALGDDVEAASVTFIGDMDAIEIPELVLEFHPVYTNHIAYCVYLAILFVLAFMLANLFGIEQRRDEYGQCASYKSDFLQVLLIWDLIFGQALYCLLYFLCRIAWAWPRRVHWNVHPTNGGMVACFRKECHQCWQQRAQRTRRDHYDDFEALDPYWAQALEEPIDPMDRTQSKPLGNDDGTAFAVLDVDSDDDITIVKK